MAAGRKLPRWLQKRGTALAPFAIRPFVGATGSLQFSESPRGWSGVGHRWLGLGLGTLLCAMIIPFWLEALTSGSPQRREDLAFMGLVSVVIGSLAALSFCWWIALRGLQDVCRKLDIDPVGGIVQLDIDCPGFSRFSRSVPLDECNIVRSLGLGTGKHPPRYHCLWIRLGSWGDKTPIFTVAALESSEDLDVFLTILPPWLVERIEVRGLHLGPAVYVSSSLNIHRFPEDDALVRVGLRCRHCRYSLKGLGDDSRVCPECGEPITIQR